MRILKYIFLLYSVVAISIFFIATKAILLSKEAKLSNHHDHLYNYVNDYRNWADFFLDY
jgi:hypothetical protein